MGKEINLGIFADNDKNIQQATLSLLSELGIKMEVITQVSISILNIMEGSLGKTPKTVQNICKKIDESYFVGVISDKTFKGGDKTASHEEACKNADEYDQMMVFAVDFKRDSKVARSEMATLTRSLNRASKACPVVLVCRYTDEGGARFAFSLCERTAYKQAGHTGEKAGKVNILRGINPNKPHTGHIRILEDMRLEKKDNTIKAVYDKWFGVFDNDVLTNKFYKELQDWFFWAVKHVKFPNDINDDTDDKIYNPQNVIRLITRLIFIWFLRQKGLVPKELFNREDLAHLVKDFEPDNFESSTYYRVILQNLFFATLNKKIEERAFISDSFIENRNQGKHNIKTFMRHASDLAVSKEEFIKLVRPVPFMNNSLFECLDNKVQNGHTYNWDGFSDSNNPQRQAFVPNYLFFAEEAYVDLSEEYGNSKKTSVKVFGLLTILKRYNFTVEENTPLDQDVALDPELLGKVFENLLAAYNPETEKTVRKSTGSYYTPRPIVQYMVNESLVAYLKESVSDVDEATLRSLLSYNDDKITTLTEQQTRRIVDAILNCKVLDPACGSGAFPMGMLQQMSHLLSRVDSTNKLWEEVVVNRALNDEAFVDTMNDEEKEAHKNEIKEVFKLSVNYPDYARKLYLIENCIYGVDIQSIAVQISRLRFFISLLCEQQPSDDASKNYNIKPLPNLEMKFVSANSLVRLENIDETRELFANKDILELIAELKGVRHELFVVTDQHVKESLLSKDDTLRKKILLHTGECYVKGTEDKIKEYEQSISRLEKELVIAERQPDDIVQSVQYNLFDEKKEIISVNRKEVKIKEIDDNMRRFKRECNRLRDTLNSGRDKAMRLAKQLTDWNPYDQNISSPFFDPDWMFGVKGGFDIVIGNPPYIDSETMTLLGQTELREYITKHYKFIKGNWDIYMAFLEWGLTLSNGYLCYITPDKWLSKPFGSKFREQCMIPRMKTILHTGNKTFESAMVDAIITLFVRSSDKISAYKFDGDKNIIHMNSVPSNSISKPYYIDSLFSENYYLIKKMEDESIILSTIAECENACATHDAYELSPCVYNLTSEYDSIAQLKLVNTGTIDKFSNRWGVKDITYLGAKYLCPVVDKETFVSNFGRAYIRKTLSKKLIFKGLNLLDAFIDLDGNYIAGKSTLVICSDNINDLKFLCGLLNSKLAIFYIKSKYASSSYCGGITFSKDMINNFPVSSLAGFKEKVISIVDKILDSGYSIDLNKLLNETIYSSYNLSSAEIKIIEQSI